MKLDHNILTGLFIGIVIGLHYGASLTAYLPIFVILGVLFLFRFVKV